MTLWKRATPQSEIAPFDRCDDLELCVIASFDDTHHGVFIFKPDVLAQKGILSVGGKGGKRAFRVYAPWTRPTAKQAIQTQTWQTRHFVDFADMEVAVAKVAQLMGEK